MTDIIGLEEKLKELQVDDFGTEHAAALKAVSGLAANPLVDKAVSQ